MKKIFLSDTFFGFLVSAFVVGGYLTRSAALETLELKFYDVRAGLRQDITPPEEIAIVAIDDASLTQLGRWPWPRSRIASMIERLHGYGAKVIGLNVLFTEPDRNPGLAELDRIKEQYTLLVSSKALVEKDPAAPAKPLPAGATSVILLEIEEAKKRLDEDGKLEATLAGKPVILPLFFDLASDLGGKPEPLPDVIARSSMTLASAPGEGFLEAQKATYPLVAFSSAAFGVGHINMVPDIDGTVRQAALAVKYGKQYFPSYAIELLRAYLGLLPEDAQIWPGQKIKLGKVEAPIDEDSLMHITWRGPENTFHYYSFFDVMNDKVNPERFKDRIVLLGPTAIGVGTLYVTPVAPNFPAVEVTATIIENLLNKKFLSRPEWAGMAELAGLVVIGLFVMLALPKLKAGMGAALSFVIFAALLGAGAWLFAARSEWVKTSYPAVLLALGYTVIVTKRFLTTEKRKELVEASQIETNKMLGLSFQGQGMLDLSFEKFRACPLDETLADLLYNLALDFERKRQYNKSVSVLEYIATKFPKYKDIEQKLDVLKRASEGAVFGGAIGKSKDSTIMTEGASMKPTLGRYEVEKELGRGAMGIVYLGKDPKINRQVAIKTMMFEAEGSAEQQKELKMRFFREAESAGNLNHPNIVRIFDAGEDNEVCYIAMELLSGYDLKEHTAKEKLLPLETVLDYMAKVADGLDFAHQAGVVHRDIKPANIMLLKDGTLRVTDFGIARIQASSKTATGTVMGTPSYMSPEQVAGKKVDGRADLWSLGVMTFEMCTGEKPFKGGEAIGTLLFQIANDPHPDPVSIRADLPSDVAAVIDRLLKKNPDERYQRGSEVAADLKRVLERMRSGAPPPVRAAAEPAAPAAAAPRAEPLPPRQPAAAASDKTMPAGSMTAALPASDKTMPAGSMTAPAAPAASDKTMPAGSMPAAAAPATPAAEKAASPSPWDRPASPAPKAEPTPPPPASAPPTSTSASPSPSALKVELGPKSGLSASSTPAPSADPSLKVELGPKSGLGTKTDVPPPPPPPGLSKSAEPVAPPPGIEHTVAKSGTGKPVDVPVGGASADGTLRIELGPKSGLLKPAAPAAAPAEAKTPPPPAAAKPAEPPAVKEDPAFLGLSDSEKGKVKRIKDFEKTLPIIGADDEDEGAR